MWSQGLPQVQPDLFPLVPLWVPCLLLSAVTSEGPPELRDGTLLCSQWLSLCSRWPGGQEEWSFCPAVCSGSVLREPYGMRGVESTLATCKARVLDPELSSSPSVSIGWTYPLASFYPARLSIAVRTMVVQNRGIWDLAQPPSRYLQLSPPQLCPCLSVSLSPFPAVQALSLVLSLSLSSFSL